MDKVAEKKLNVTVSLTAESVNPDGSTKPFGDGSWTYNNLDINQFNALQDALLKSAASMDFSSAKK